MKCYVAFVFFSSFASLAFGQQPTALPSSSQPVRALPRFDAYSIFFSRESGNVFGGSLGISIFDKQTFYVVGLLPELELERWGVGLDINLRISQQGQLRQEDWRDGISSYLRLLRYVRYGFKRDSLYFRLGQLNAARLGHGSIMFLYRNNASYDARRLGIEFDADFGHFGLESVVSDVSTFYVVGVRPFWRPLHAFGSGLELGATVVSDFNENANLRLNTGVDTAGTNGQKVAVQQGSLVALGVDASVPIVRLPMVDADLHFDVAGIVGYGAGIAAGISGSLKNLFGIAVVSAKLEQRLLADQFQFAYFDALYEQERYRQSDAAVTARSDVLRRSARGGLGIYGELGGSILGKFSLFGSYQQLYRSTHGALLQLSARFEELIPALVFRADYFKRNFSLENLFTLDEQTFAQVEFSYLPYPYLSLSVVYQWTFLPVRGENNTILRYEPLQRLEPRVSLRLQF
ncbi:MAG: hypothetical protein ACK41G_05615 [Candidatus Thermochlorobacter sp.]